MEPFSADSLEAAFRKLSRELQSRRVHAHIYVVGGAAMALGFDGRRQSMDAVIKEGHGPVVEAVRRIGRRRGWPKTWLNEEAVPSMPRGPDGRARTVFGDRHLVVNSASAEHLLAMKVRAARPKDQEDIAFLVRRLGLSSGREDLDLHDEVSPHDPPKGSSIERACKIPRNLWPHDRSLDRDDRYGLGLAPGTGRGGRSR
ncbi:MAG: hypothetical protein OXN89_20325 [Bryobacterales bacterium]|nr:hypothetical protein [Bryobacterales bacterium]